MRLMNCGIEQDAAHYPHRDMVDVPQICGKLETVEMKSLKGKLKWNIQMKGNGQNSI